MPFKDLTKRKLYAREYARMRRSGLPRLPKGRIPKYPTKELRMQRNRELNRKYWEQDKLKVLMHCGKNGQLLCCWDDCTVNDIDMLTVDHMQDNGAEERRHQNVSSTYYWLLKQGLPKGYQTLCHNHQWKKEMHRRRMSRL